MVPKFLQIKGQEIAFYQSNNDGFPVVFIHGNSLSAKTFASQFKNELFSKYQLIGLDLPGHGATDYAKKPEKMYTLFGYSDLLSDFLNALQIKKAVLIGHSLGGHITLHSIKKLQEIITGIAIFGTPPISIPMNMELAYHPNPSFALAFKEKHTKKELLQLAGSYINQNGDLLEEIADSISKTDPKMRRIMGESTGRGEFVHELEILNNAKIPLAVIHGEKDSMINPDYFESIHIKNFWKNETQFIQDAGHCPQLEKPEEFNKVLNFFLEDILS